MEQILSNVRTYDDLLDSRPLQEANTPRSRGATTTSTTQALTADRSSQAMPIIAFQMAAMYLGSAVGAAFGGGLLTAGTGAADLAVWALIPAVLALALTGWVAARNHRNTPETVELSCTPAQ